MRRSFLVPLVPALAFAAATFASTRQARADGPVIGLDLDLGTAIQTPYRGTTAVDFSVGGGARLGWRYNIPRTYVWLQPELGGHYTRFGFNGQYLTGEYEYGGTLNGGLRVGLQGIVQPNAFTHIGMGFMGYDLSPTTSVLRFGPNFDIGAGLDFRVVRGFTLGAQIGYNMAFLPTVDNAVAAKWVNFGLVANFVFGDAPARRRVYYRY